MKKQNKKKKKERKKRHYAVRENLYNAITKLVTREFCCMEILLIVIGRTEKKIYRARKDTRE